MEEINSADPFSLTGKRILVTGASSGIGRQIAISCAEMGAQLVITGRDASRLSATFSMLKGQGHQKIQADLNHSADIEQLVSTINVLNGLVHAAGTSKLVPFHLANQAHVESTFRDNTFAPMFLTRHLLSRKKIAPAASIVFIAAVASYAGPAASSAYSASKSALLGAARSMAKDLAKQSIRVNCVAPGYVQTPMLEKLDSAGANQNTRAQWTPLGIGETEDIANATTFYLSDASQAINQSYFTIDGGISIGMTL
ncbi:MAG: SDR family oxidoreductase [Oxalicibacterium faecigallinarum]|uniref:SDR family NAD(P)-dependent oxidoreductase n=1 Tax=Oxalicibacterium faecigallinarum TaxID=573741 RepID=UPI002806E8A9|nr:SDR family oxidoreductase [Oxalicibacterium faecigallinarum]MDQ7969176.1 SDR family oxidoreductase [Oxalicibacterium faecigallinarum]